MKKQAVAWILALTVAVGTWTSPVLAENQESLPTEEDTLQSEIFTNEESENEESQDESMQDEDEDASLEDQQQEEEITENASEAEVTEETEAKEAAAEDLYEKSYLFALREGVDAPTDETGFVHLALNIYMADSEEEILSVYESTDLEYIEENGTMEFFDETSRKSAPNDHYYSKQREYLESIGASYLWSEKVSGSNTTVAIIDSGLYSGHEDFDSVHILDGYNYVKDNTDTKDTAGHGTQVAGVIAAVRNNKIGVAGLIDDVNILPLRISADNASQPTIAAAAKAITDCVDTYQVDVINMSIGQSDNSETLETAVKYAYENQIIMVAAAGNSGKEGETDPLLYPAAYDEVIGVGSVDAQGNLRSNSQKNESVFVTAPGENIYTTDVNNKYTIKSGTSYSAPIVAAMAVAAKEKNTQMSVDDFKNLLIASSVDQGEEGYDIAYGYGVVNMKNFLEALYDKTISEREESGFEIKYQRAYGSTLTDAFSAVAATKDGGYVAVGYTFKESTDPVWDYVITSESSPNANNDAIVVKFDAEARIEWAKSFGTTGVDILSDVCVLDNGVIVGVGRAPYDFGSGKNTASGYVLRISPNDPEDYEEVHIGGTAGDYAEGCTATSDGGYVVVGRTSSRDSENWTKVNTQSSTADAFLIKYDAEGNFLFSKTYNTNDKRSYFYKVEEDSDGNLIAVGDTQEKKFIYNAQIVKFDGQTGEVLWARSEGSSLAEAPANANEGHTSIYEAIAVLEDGSYVAVGSTKTTGSSTDDTNNWGIIGERDGIVVHYTQDGTIISAENIGTINGTVDLSSVLGTNDGGYMVYGQTSDTPDDSEKYDWTLTGAIDTIIIKYGSDDSLEWNQAYGIENKGVWFNDILQNADGTYFIAGESNWRDSSGKVDAAIWTSYEVEGDPESIQSDEQEEELILADGVFEGRAVGFNPDAEVVVSVTVEDGKIKEAKLVDHEDTAEYMNKAQTVLTAIVEKNTYNVDSVTGATYSSNGLKNAVKNALQKSEEKAQVKTFTITYKTNKGTLKGDYPETFSSDMEENLNLTEVVPTRKGYTFAGWYETKDFSSAKVKEISAERDEDITLYAKWKANKYSVTFVGGKNTTGKMSKLTNCVYDTKFKLTANKFKKKGYKFKGWTTKKGSTKVVYKNKASVKNLTTKSKGKVTLYAVWEKNK